MSYVRFGSDGSDVYVYLDTNGYLCCCACSMSEDWKHSSTDDMVSHLREHAASRSCPGMARAGPAETPTGSLTVACNAAAPKLSGWSPTRTPSL